MTTPNPRSVQVAATDEPGRERATPLVPCQSDPQQSCLCRRAGNGGTSCRHLLHKAGLLHREAGHDGYEGRCQPCMRASAAHWTKQRGVPDTGQEQARSPIQPGRYFDVSERLRLLEPVWSNEYHLTETWAPVMPLLDELRVPLWWTPAGYALGPAPS